MKKRDELHVPEEQLHATVSGLELNSIRASCGSTQFSPDSIDGVFSARNESSSRYIHSHGVSATSARPFSVAQSPHILLGNGSSSSLSIQGQVASDGWRGIPTFNAPRDNNLPLQLQQPNRTSSIAFGDSAVCNSTSTN